jgi:hypothetical protein
MDAENKQPGFSVAIPTNDPLSYVAQQLFEMRVELGTLSVLVMDGLVAAGKTPAEVAGRSETVRENLRLELAFLLQDRDAETPEE